MLKLLGDNALGTHKRKEIVQADTFMLYVLIEYEARKTLVYINKKAAKLLWTVISLNFAVIKVFKEC